MSKLSRSVAKQRAEQDAAVKWERPKPPIRDAVKIPIKRPGRNRVYMITAEDSDGYIEGEEPEIRRVRVSSHGNKKLKDFDKVFAGAFKAAMKSTPFDDADDAPFTRYGISFRVPAINNMKLAKGAMREWLNINLPLHASAHIVESESTLTFHLNFGKYDDYSTVGEAVSDLQKKKRFITDAMDKTRDFTDSQDEYIWFAEWDWDEDVTRYEPK